MTKINKRNRSNKRRCNPGLVTRNTYLNFCRDFRKKNVCQPLIQQIKEAAKAWHKLSTEEKNKYIVEAFYAKKVRHFNGKLPLRKKSSAARRHRKR